MSVSRECVIWPSENGRWSFGMYDCYPTGDQSDPDWDFEWDVEYNYDAFQFASTGHATIEDAYRSWHGANPGGYSAYEKRTPECSRLDMLAAAYLKAEQERAASRRGYRSSLRYGPGELQRMRSVGY
jgi:hypothetical protein